MFKQSLLFCVLSSVLSLPALAQRQVPPPPPPQEVRPDGMTVGVGVGYIFPRSILEPNTASVRFRLGGGLTLEPVVNLGGGTSTTGTVATLTSGPNTVSTQDGDTGGGLNLGAGANVRYALASAGPVDFVGLAGVGVHYGSRTTHLDVFVENQTQTRTNTSLQASLNWGLSVEWFITRNIVLSADATNPLASWTNTTSVERSARTGDNPRSQEERSSTTALDFGLVFNPSVRLMFHLYF